MPNHADIYAVQADMYEQLVSKQASLYETIQTIIPVEGLDIIDMGAGAGRLTRILAPQAKTIVALDESESMLRINADHLSQADLHNWQTQVADHRHLPAANHSADLIVSGWSICYLGNSEVDQWEANIHQVISEIRRVLRPGGTVIIIENFGTGSETPHPPDFLMNYYRLLESEYGFSHSWIRTDYTFESVDEAEMLTRFFFGDAIADKVVSEQLTTLPECAGIWWLTV
ncbi:methyltransferase domain-containing protein [Paenibacillus sp. LMG 31461]|uniref:Methyltransferase domain-containing protein n=1 Tax=Paenibacillus plantarum TaxID=2654975 RepID=A0ABX1XCZ2_9BACL|nr:class I SAM-dependent methyltransferase [Paenibacillus plantarum]NOU65824.1 methyltransferase domain-containing protein [Paenibacillus plantarum]